MTSTTKTNTTSKWSKTEDGYKRDDVEITDNGGGFGDAKGSGRWAVTIAGKWIANVDTLDEAKALADKRAYVEIERDAMPAHSFRYGQLASIERVDAPLDAWLVCTECAHFDGDSTTDFSIVLVAHFVVSDESEARRIASEITDRGTTLVRPAKTTTLAATYATYDDAKAALDTAALDVAADMGEDAVEAGWGDLVRSIAVECTPDVAADLIRRNA